MSTIFQDEIRKNHGGNLQLYREEIIQKWKEHVIVAENDLFKDELIENGHKCLDLLIQYLMNEITLEDCHFLTKKIAYERMLAKANIGEFVYNSNKARSIIHSYVIEKEEVSSLKNLMIRIDDFFDVFIYQTVLEYSTLMNKSLEHKTQFIEESHKDRLTILGQMSASFVHEFRNPLTSIMGFIKLLQSEYEDIPYLTIMEHELEQLNYRISQFLLASKREQDETPAVFCLKELLDEMLEFLYPSILSGKVEVEQHIEAIEVYAIRTELKQVFLNILMNSLEALKEVNYKRIITLTAHIDNKQAKICIQNNGPAIPKEKQETIFEPFVTSKTFGTGIGLFVCKEIILKHKGQIKCHSNEYRTQFLISIPIF